jgi:hypothetical protein
MLEVGPYSIQLPVYLVIFQRDILRPTCALCHLWKNPIRAVVQLLSFLLSNLRDDKMELRFNFTKPICINDLQRLTRNTYT